MPGQRIIHPDFWPNPNQDARTPQRATPPALGGVAAPLPAEHSKVFADIAEPRTNIDDRATHALERLTEQQRAREIDISGSGVANASGIAICDMGGPAPGFLWVVRRLNHGPVDYTAGALFTGVTTIAVKAAQANPGQANNLPSASGGTVISQTTVFPAEGTWGRGELVMLEGERLMSIHLGLTVGFEVTSGGHAQQFAVGVGQTYGL